MGCCMSNESSNKVSAHRDVQFEELPMSEALKYDKNFKGPLSKRSCTDVFCLMIFVIFLVCWGFIAKYAISNGDLDRLLVPTDTEGRKCGVDSEVVHKPYLVFFNLEKCIDPTVPLYGCKTPQVCVEQCPTTSFIYVANQCTANNFYDIRSRLICQMDVNKDRDIRICDDITRYIKSNRCAEWYLKSESFSRRCLPFSFEDYKYLIENGINVQLEALMQAVENLKILSTVNGMGQMIVEDVIESWQYILYGLLGSMFCCLIIIAVLRWLATPMVWFSILGVIGLLGFATYYTFRRYLELKRNPPTETIIITNLEKFGQTWLQKTETWLYTSIVLAVALVIILLVVLVLRKRIVIAIALVKEGSKAVSSIYSTVFFPIFPWLIQIAIIGFAIAIGLYLASVGEPVNKMVRMDLDTKCVCSGPALGYKNGEVCDPRIFNQNCFDSNSRQACQVAACHFKEIKSPQFIKYFHMVNIFGFFWTMFFITALGEMVLAATFATWYWTFHKTDVPYFTLTVGLSRTIRYHLGTVAFGSLIITICRVIRVILEYIDRKLKQYDNDVTRCIMCCLKCFFWCLEKFLRFMNKNAYIMCAIHGKGFCTSARDAFNLLMRNFLRVIALDQVTEFLFFLTKILVTMGMGAVTYIYFTSDKVEHHLHYVEVPVVIVMLGTYLIASVFFGVYSMAVDSLFLCFLEDCERNDGSAEKPYFMSKQLMKILGKKNSVPRDQYH